MYYNDQIWHWGVKGMKWGVRHYQNVDGSLTPEGKQRYASERLKGVADAGNQMAGNLKAMNDKSIKIQSRRAEKMDLSKMTDQEMRERINRAMLEKQYDDMFNPKKVYSGREAVSDTLEVAGSVLAITSSALSIALAIQKLREG